MGRRHDIPAGIRPGRAQQYALAVAGPPQHAMVDVDVIAVSDQRVVRAVLHQVRVAVQQAVDLDLVPQKRHGGGGNDGVGGRRRSAGKQHADATDGGEEGGELLIWSVRQSQVSCQWADGRWPVADSAASRMPRIPDSRLPLAQLGQVRSMKVVSTRASSKARWSRIFWCKGMVVLTPSSRSSPSARFIEAMASRRLG